MMRSLRLLTRRVHSQADIIERDTGPALALGAEIGLTVFALNSIPAPSTKAGRSSKRQNDASDHVWR